MAIGTSINIVGGLFVFLVVPLALAEESRTEIIPPLIKKEDQSYTWGSVKNGDKLSKEQLIYYPCELGVTTQRFISVYCDPGTNISKIEFIDHWKSGHNAEIRKIVIQYDVVPSIIIDFQQQRHMGTAYTVKVWGTPPKFRGLNN